MQCNTLHTVSASFSGHDENCFNTGVTTTAHVSSNFPNTFLSEPHNCITLRYPKMQLSAVNELFDIDEVR